MPGRRFWSAMRLRASCPAAVFLHGPKWPNRPNELWRLYLWRWRGQPKFSGVFSLPQADANFLGGFSVAVAAPQRFCFAGVYAGREFLGAAYDVQPWLQQDDPLFLGRDQVVDVAADYLRGFKPWHPECVIRRLQGAANPFTFCQGSHMRPAALLNARGRSDVFVARAEGDAVDALCHVYMLTRQTFEVNVHVAVLRFPL